MICCIYFENLDKHLLTYPATVIDNPHLYIYIEMSYLLKW